MRIYIDSADIHCVEQALGFGFVYGVTTNPTLLQRAGVRAGEVPALARRILELGARELHLQVYAEDTSGMREQGLELAGLAPDQVVVKIPATPAGFAAAAQLHAAGVRVTLTAVYTLAQAILAPSVGASYIAVYLGRMRDQGLDSLELVGQMQRTLDVQRAAVEILAASVRAPDEVEQVAGLGIAAVTLPFAVLAQLPRSERTEAAAAAFTKAARAIHS